MPLFNQYGPKTIQVSPGDTVALLNNEAVVSTNNSVVITPLDSGPVARHSITFTMTGTGTYNVMGSNTYPTTSPQNGAVLGSPDSAPYQDQGGYAFYWINCTGSGTATIVAHVS